ncbi:hypothetical protein VUJ49_06930 [Pseudomonas berkeleyensis]|uniref:Uncharacterized protein n=1 Tax=Pseudomonas berkeleyensis TaxID=2726956 RepID=A0A7G5DSR0_9PSED|nr:hypothetical protein [Pseudomonas berkeleyensis]QMV64785.1 hypothetical protein HS968_06905 [Pseudomonas berkeleyensis]WSO40254.1 hypothetical protein VUJ49_06930 [Pseudomonas berkeleyensis]
MQAQDLETVTPAKSNEQTDIHERQPYLAPSLVQLELKRTEGSTPGGVNDGLANYS